MRVIKPGILDTFQDSGRFGYAHLGVGQTGCMDQNAGQLANLLVGNPVETAVLEMHFPAPELEFTTPVTIALTGADFCGRVNGITIPNNRRVSLPAHSTIAFKQKIWGQRCYLAVQGGWALEKVMGSYSTHLKAGFGGFEGRALKKGDFISLNNVERPTSEIDDVQILKWFAGHPDFYYSKKIRVLKGPEWHWLTEEAIHLIEHATFTISCHSDRMGYQLHGLKLKRKVSSELLSSGVLPGTIQLLPNGQPLILMADCQTTGGYPRILQVIEADLAVLAQRGAGERIGFELVEVGEAVDALLKQAKDLEKLHSGLLFV
jgi:antagonist of KipI